jgi:hypothetical protein
MSIKAKRLKRSSTHVLGALIAGLCLGTSAYADPIIHTITENGVDWTSAGISGVGAGTGDITLAGVTGPVDTARLYWHGIDSGGDGNYDNATVTIDGNVVVGTAIGTANTNCWGSGNSVAYQADVSAFVAGDGVYTIAGMSDGAGHNANGASIVVTFDDGNPANNRDLAYFEGNDSNIPAGFPGEDDGWHAVLTPINYDGAGTVGIQFHNADGQTFTDGDLTLDTGAGPLVIPDAVGLWEGTSVPSAGTSRAPNGELWDIHSFDITRAFAPVAGAVSLNLDGMEFTSDCLGLVLALVDLPAGSLPGGDDFSKTLLDGPDENGDGEVDLVIPVKPSTSTTYQWVINWSQADAPDVMIADTAPAESVVNAINGDATGLPIGCGEDAAFDDDSGHIDVYRGGKSGKSCRSATELEWWPGSDSEMLVVDVSMRESPGNGHKEDVFAPTSCGALNLNYGAAAFELDPDTGLPVVDPDTGEVLPPIMESNALCIAAVNDDGTLDYTGAGDHDLDGAEDWAEACEVGTDPCNPDTDGDGVLDGADECPLEGPPDASIGEVQDPNGCNRQSQCSDGIDNDDDGPIDFDADASCDSLVDDSEDTVDCPCWNANDLESVTADNHRDDFSCGTQTTTEALIQAISGTTPGVEGGFAADPGPYYGYPGCETRDLPPGVLEITADEAQNCMAQINARCAAIGYPVLAAPAALSPVAPSVADGDTFGTN